MIGCTKVELIKPWPFLKNAIFSYQYNIDHNNRLQKPFFSLSWETLWTPLFPPFFPIGQHTSYRPNTGQHENINIGPTLDHTLAIAHQLNGNMAGVFFVINQHPVVCVITIILNEKSDGTEELCTALAHQEQSCFVDGEFRTELA